MRWSSSLFWSKKGHREEEEDREKERGNLMAWIWTSIRMVMKLVKKQRERLGEWVESLVMVVMVRVEVLGWRVGGYLF